MIQLLSYNYVFSIAYLLTMVAIVLAVIQQRGDPTKTLAWTLFIALVPFVGLLFYVMLGKNYRRDKLLSRKEMSDQQQLASMMGLLTANDGYLSWFPSSPSEAHFKGIAQMLAHSNKTFPTRNNRAQLLVNATEKYTALFNAIEQAQDHIHLEYYIIKDDSTGNRLREALVRKAQQGVEVQLIYDYLGSWGLSSKYLRSLAENGVQAYPFLPVKLSFFRSKINHRNHRKIVVVDGKVAFVGGINIADHYLNGLPEIGVWRDTHVQLMGDAVRWLQIVFLLDWYFVSKQSPSNMERYLPAHSVSEKCTVQIAASGPDSDWASIMQTYFAAINRSSSKLYIATPYFVPNESMLTALCAAALRGVDVRLLISERSDSSIMQWASMSYIDTLLEAGVHVFLYSKGVTHSKLLMADGEFCSVGTANMDVRSFEHNFEVNALFYDRQFTQQLEEMFLHDLQYSVELDLEEWQKRPRRERFMENLSRLLAPML
ncbi:MAG: cardiolipin synthase [Prevotellaceae bacterium]|nr:cardiolipin synthase [Prevotellaceae bacterium]